MNTLVGDLILSGGEKVTIRFSDGRKENFTYIETVGYTNYFRTDNGKELRLSNHFMEMKDITVSLCKE